MQSSSRLGVETRVFLLVSLLFLAGISLPFDVLRQVESLPYQGGTYLFLSFLFALLQKPHSLQTLSKHPQEAENLLNYFAKPDNYNESYWWLQHKPQLLNLFSDEKTFLILAKSPWLFKPLHSLIDYSPSEFDVAISNRTFFNDLLNLASDHPDLQTILTSNPLIMIIIIEEPSLLPRLKSTLSNAQIESILVQNPTLFPYFLFNPTLILPTTADWILILQPANSTIIATPLNVLVLIYTSTNSLQPAVNLFRNQTTVTALNGKLQVLHRLQNGTTTYLYNATLNPNNLTAATYLLQANITTDSVGYLTYQIVVQIVSSATSPTIQLAAAIEHANLPRKAST